jgi:hypothetical protein
MDLVDGEVWCEVHGCVHDQTTDPYGYEYALSGEEPECSPSDWRRLWAGARMTLGACFGGDHEV